MTNKNFLKKLYEYKRPSYELKQRRNMGPMNLDNDPHPKTIIATCEILGCPLPQNATCQNPPSQYIKAGKFDGTTISIKEYLKNYYNKKDEELLNKYINSFRRKYKSQKNILFTPTDFTIYFCDWFIFAKDRGFTHNCYFDYELYNKEPEIRDTFLNEGYRIRVHNACTTKGYRKIFKNKAIFNETFKKFIQRDWIDASTCSFEEFNNFIKKHKTFFGKPVKGTGGTGARIIERNSDSPEKLYGICKSENLILEEIIEQHKELAEFNDTALNTVRITTLLCADNKARIVLATARFGRKGNVVDNFHGGGVGAVVDIDTGKIISEAINQAHERSAFHPDSHKMILGFQYPEWEKIKAAVCEAATYVPEMRNIGWDVAVTKNGDIEFVEGNGRPNYDVLQSPDQVGRKYRYEPFLADIEALKGIKVENYPPLIIDDKKLKKPSRNEMDNYFAFIDSIENIELLDSIEKEYKDHNIMKIFWENYGIARTGLTNIIRKRAVIKCRYICLMYNASIPFSKQINRFRTPHGLRGILLSSYAKIGTGCVIFQNVTIGSNTLEGSKNAGFPTIGNNVYIGAGASIIGNVKIGNNVRIGANCIVTEDVPDNSIVVLNKPKIILKDETLNNEFISAKKFKMQYLNNRKKEE